MITIELSKPFTAAKGKTINSIAMDFESLKTSDFRDEIGQKWCMSDLSFFYEHYSEIAEYVQQRIDGARIKR